MNAPLTSPLAGFWTRPLAYLIDILILGLVQWGIFVNVGDYLGLSEISERFISFLIGLVYFTVQNSSLCNGQTPGNRICKIQVVGIDGTPIAPAKACIRYCVLFIPLYFNNLLIPLSRGPLLTFVECIAMLMIFGVCPATIYLYIANRKTRQSLHDLAAGSYVRRIIIPWSAPEPINRIHLRIVIGWFVLLLIAQGMMAMNSIAPDKTMMQLQAVRQAVLEDPDIQNATVTKFTPWQHNASPVLVVNVRSRHKVTRRDTFLLNLVPRILTAAPDGVGCKGLQVNVSYGINLGFFSLSEGFRDAKSLEEWNRTILLLKAAHE